MLEEDSFKHRCSTVTASGTRPERLLPEMKNYRPPGNGNGREDTAMVLKTLKPDKRSIVNVLDAHGGSYLQKYITKYAGQDTNGDGIGDTLGP